MGHTTITSGYVAPAVVALTDAATIAVDASLGNDFRVTVAAGRTMANPANPVDGQRITFQIAQGGSGGNAITWSSQYKFGAAGSPTLTSTAGAVDVLGFIYNASLASWLCVGTALDF
jgi:hypothetical protein